MAEFVEYVQDQYAQMAHKMEERLAALPPEAGILFASVRAIPDKFGQSRGYWVTVGVPHHLHPDTGQAVSRRILEEMVPENTSLVISSVCGTSGSTR